MSALQPPPRFPSGSWQGFFLEADSPRRHAMQLRLTIRRNRVTGSGQDYVGDFRISGQYDLESLRFELRKRYVGRHTVDYRGLGLAEGIVGEWTIGRNLSGPFHIWPTAQGDGTRNFEVLFLRYALGNVDFGRPA